MVARRPLVLVSGVPAELPSGDDLAGAQSRIGGGRWAMAVGGNTASMVAIGGAGLNNYGTNSAPTVDATNALTMENRCKFTSATTASALAGHWTNAVSAFYSTTALRGGFEQVCRFGVSQLPTGPRVFAGMGGIAAYSTAEPSAGLNFAAIAKDSTDTNLQLMTNSGSGTANKVDTGIALVANGWYETAVWSPPGGGIVYARVVRLDTGEVWLGSSTTKLPATGTRLMMHCFAGLNATNTGTAAIVEIGSMYLRSSF